MFIYRKEESTTNVATLMYNEVEEEKEEERIHITKE